MAHLKGGTYVGGDLIVMTDVYANVVRSFAASGTSPFVINSSTLVNNLNVNYLGGYPAAYFASAASLSNYLPLSGGSVTGKAWFSYGNTAAGGYSWVDAALTTNSIEIVNSNGVSSNVPTLAFHTYGSGGPQFRLASDNILWLESAGNNSARTATASSANFNSLRLISANSHGIYINGNNVWHAGNDGSGSGLDADTVDGYQASSLVKTLGTINNNIDSDYGEGFVTFDPVPTGTPPLSSPNIRTINVGNVFSRRTQLAFDYDTDRAFFRRRIDGGWQSWYEFVHTGNISSQVVGFAGLTVTSVTQNSHGLSVGNIIRVSGANTFVKAQANSSANAEVVGYVTSVTDANNFKYTTGGMVSAGVPAASPGTVYYLDPTTAGAITSTEPGTTGQVSKPVLIIIESAAKAAFVNFRGFEIADSQPLVTIDDNLPVGSFSQGAFWYDPSGGVLATYINGTWVATARDGKDGVIPTDFKGTSLNISGDSSLNTLKTSGAATLNQLRVNNDSSVNGLTVVGTTSLQQVLEKATISTAAVSGTINFDALSQSVMYCTSTATANWTLNVRGNSGTTLNSLMSIGQSLSIAFMATQGSTAYYGSTFQVDSSTIVPKWQGGSAPTSGNASSIDTYTYTILKTANATYTVFATQSKFA